LFFLSRAAPNNACSLPVTAFDAPTTVSPTKRTPVVWLALAAIQTGIVAGGVALVYLLLDGIVGGEGPWFFLNLLGATFYPRRAFSLVFSRATLSGLALHVVVSGVAGLLFAILLAPYRAKPLRSLWLGAFLGGVWYYLVFRYFWVRVDPALVLYQSFPGVFLGHVVFGLCMGLYPRFVGLLPGRQAQ
jgi:hypothetical protein